MCGVVGIVERRSAPEPGRVAAMRDRLRHRGPDDAGLWCEGRVALGHRRLSIIDLSPEGHQPMVSASGRFVIAYNGEVYNYRSLRSLLEVEAWRGRSDTEVVLEAMATWGVPCALEKLVGMFAIALYDRWTQELWLARDRLGKKPLYYGWIGDQFVFGSELGIVEAIQDAELNVSREALALLLRHGHIPGPRSIYSELCKLRPGHYLRLTPDDIEKRRYPQPIGYWTLEAIAPSFAGDERDAEAALLELLRDAVRCRLMSDVPLGAFLSGGIDSSLVCAVMQEVADGPVKTFTMGFREPEFDEAVHARRVAEHLGTQHTEMYVSEHDLLSAVAELPLINDEPFADSSLLPTYLVSRLARRSVTVVLSGDGGDELFWGYTRYAQLERLWRSFGWIPAGFRRELARAMRSRVIGRIARRIPSPYWLGRRAPLADKLRRASELLEFSDERELYRFLISHWKHPEEVVIEGLDPVTIYSDDAHWTHSLPSWRRMAVQDLLSYLPNDILSKIDRASMAVSLEARVPLLDHRVVELVATLPEDLIRRAGQGKWLLRRLLARYVPASLTERPKQGFGVPLGSWLRGPLKEWAHDLLSEQRLASDGYFRPHVVRSALQEHAAGTADWSPYLWDVLMFQSWLHERSKVRARQAA